MEQQPILPVAISRVAQGQVHESEDLLAIEEPLELSLVYGPSVRKTVSVTMRTPGSDAALAAGFLFTEGIIQSASQIEAVQHLPLDDNRIAVRLQPDAVPFISQMERNFYTTSSCGVCGKTSIEAIKTVSPFTEQQDQLRARAEVLYSLPDRLRSEQAVFDRTGGLHASALFNPDGELLLLCEDVGRHNALDKLVGSALLQGMLPLSRHLLLLSGRTSFELVQKAAMAGIRLIAAVGAPSSLAVQLAADCGITLAGFLRDSRFNIYTHPQRIMISDYEDKD